MKQLTAVIIVIVLAVTMVTTTLPSATVRHSAEVIAALVEGDTDAARIAAKTVRLTLRRPHFVPVAE